uniref:Similar to ATP-dependent helicase n=1 Tax=Arundo donax TaxID=35708 RepID=A0A0A9CQ13_ARUDO
MTARRRRRRSSSWTGRKEPSRFAAAPNSSSTGRNTIKFLESEGLGEARDGAYDLQAVQREHRVGLRGTGSGDDRRRKRRGRGIG